MRNTIRAALMSVANYLLGWPRYRVRFIYKDGQREVLNFTVTLGVSDPKDISNERRIKQLCANVHQRAEGFRFLLCNGDLQMEPECYLGRWHQ